MSDSHALEVILLLKEYLRSEHAVNQSYAAACMEGLLAKKTNGRPLFNETNIGQVTLSQLL